VTNESTLQVLKSKETHMSFVRTNEIGGIIMTETEQEELETLRNEKRIRLQTARAEKALGEAKIPASFASLLVGADDAETDRKTADFCAAYQKELSESVRSRLPERAPVVTPTTPRPAQRGIRRIR
jgi:hypothetical protein